MKHVDCSGIAFADCKYEFESNRTVFKLFYYNLYIMKE